MTNPKTASATWLERIQTTTSLKTTSCAEIQVVWIGEKLVNGSNSRAHPMAKAAIAKRQRQGILLRLGNLLRTTTCAGPWEVTIVRLAPRFLDSDDNLNISAKHIRDGIADALGVNDGDKEKISFKYAQEKFDRYGVRVTIRSRAV